jgi:acetylglutamate kinase
MQARLGLKPVKVDGLRVTDAESLTVAQMVLSGLANKALVVALLAAGVEAVGLSGVDGGILRCQKKEVAGADLGFVGEIVSVRSDLLLQLTAQRIMPVVSPISLGIDGQVYNVNADEAAGAIAAALPARVLHFISNVPGVLDRNGRLIARLTPARTERLIDEGVIHGGMVPKVRAALDVIGRGVPQARIVDLAQLAQSGGTTFTHHHVAVGKGGI